VCERERESLCVYVCVCVDNVARGVCVGERERERVCVCMYVCVSIVLLKVCVCERERDRESASTRARVHPDERETERA